MKDRAELQALLVDLIGSPNVYFQPPPKEQMAYPCIVYRRNLARTLFSDNRPYNFTRRYLVTVVDTDADSDIPGKVAMLPMCSFLRFYTAEGLNHDVFNLFF